MGEAPEDLRLLARRSRVALETTETEERLMAAAAMMGGQ